MEVVKGVAGRIWHALKTGARGLIQAKGVYCLERIPPSPYSYVDVYMKRIEETFLWERASISAFFKGGLLAPNT